MKLLKAAFFLVSLCLVFSTNVFAYVAASPSYSDLGTVTVGSSAMQFISIVNYSNQSIPFFNVYCNGDLSVFSCSTSCYSLRPYGSCTVYVRFYPRNGDNLRKMVNVQGYGGGWFTNSTVYGTDGKNTVAP